MFVPVPKAPARIRPPGISSGASLQSQGRSWQCWSFLTEILFIPCGIPLHPFVRQIPLLKLTVKLDNLRLHILRLRSEMLEESVLQRMGFVARKADRRDDNALRREMELRM